MKPITELRTKRLLLRQWKPSDREPFAALNADPEVMNYFGYLLDREQSDSIARDCETFIEERGWGFWAVERLDTEAFIGFVGLHVPDAKLPCSPCVEIGWRLSRDQWGQGFATEAALASLRFGFEELGLDEIVAYTPVLNQRSRKVMERIGMTDTDETFVYPTLPEEDPLSHFCLYRYAAGGFR